MVNIFLLRFIFSFLMIS